ncbi:hypothetical protein [Bradyrhizobium sp. Arg816]|uniref:hypothetical protein n=1 Tax=Bradyrhizobium sp. Arg816 TaxID=2998491 RepID=UPI00249F1B9E|nr:hypothetical protein [Bradyrhizobium sp. Arg816]MDI3564206.1 hypothetical protein [Bradyrhizobium sp. Arg816]
MEYVRFAVKFTSFALIALLIGGYGYLVYTGDIPKPDVDAIVRQVAPSMTTGGSVIVGIAIAVCVFLTAIAPFIYAARSGDAFTIIVSIVALIVCFVMLASSRTVVDMVLAAIVYFTSALISVVMYSTRQIVGALREREMTQSISLRG